MKFTKKSKLGCFFVFTIILFVLVGFYQYRHFYTVENITFTCWKSKKECYITPYRYLGIFPPKKNYIKASNTGAVQIFIDNNTKFFIFNDWIHDNTSNEVYCNFENFDYEQISGCDTNFLTDFYAWERKRKYYEDSLKLPYIDIDIKYMNMRVRE
jgi:hypothetical protein